MSDLVELRALRAETVDQISELESRLERHHFALSNCAPSPDLGRQSREFEDTINKKLAHLRKRYAAIEQQIDEALGLGVGSE